MAAERFYVRGRRTRTPRRVQLLFAIPLLCVLLLGTFVTYRLFPFGHSKDAQASSLVQLHGHVPGLVKRSTLQGPTDPNTPLQLLVGFQLRNQQSLKNYVDTMSHPHSTTAHRYLTPAQIARAYAPAPASQSALIAYMQQASFSVTSTYSQHLTIGFKGTIGQAEQAFHIQINNYRAPNGRIFYAPGSDPSVPAYLAPVISSISRITPEKGVEDLLKAAVGAVSSSGCGEIVVAGDGPQRVQRRHVAGAAACRRGGQRPAGYSRHRDQRRWR